MRSHPFTPLMLALSSLALPAAAQEASDLAGFLAGVERATRAEVPVRGTGTVTINGIAGKTEDRIVVLQRPNGDRYVEFKNAGVRLLVTPGSPKGAGVAFLVAGPGSTPAPAKRDAVVAGSDFTREDFEAFAAANYDSARIADESPVQRTLTLTPPHSQYVLVVTTFDREKLLPTRTLLYLETVKNLVKMMRQSDHVQVGKGWFPTTISMEHFQLRTSTEIKLQWSEEPAAPAQLFDSAALGKPSPIRW